MNRGDVDGPRRRRRAQVLGFAGTSWRDEAPPPTPASDRAGPRRSDETLEAFVARKCERCATNLDAAAGAQEHATCIFLHALRYAGPGWSFETREPDWARGPPEEERASWRDGCLCM